MLTQQDQSFLRRIKSIVLSWIDDKNVALITSLTGSVPSPHDLDSGYHSGSLNATQFPTGLLVDGSRALAGNMSVAVGVTIDGVDISVFRSDYLGHVANPNAHHLSFVGLRDDAGTVISPDGAGYAWVRGGAGMSANVSTNGITVTLITPGTLAVASANANTGSHTHAITSSSSPGAAAALLATSATGGLFLDTTLLAVDAANDKIGMGRVPAISGALLQAQGIADLFSGAETIARLRADPLTGWGQGSGVVAPDAWLSRTAAKQGKWYDGTPGGAADLAVTGKLVAGVETFTSPAAVTSRSQTEALRLEYDDINFVSFKVSGGGNLELIPTGDLVFNPTGNDILPLNNYDLNFGAINKKYLTIHAAELWVETLVAQDTIATIGGRILVGPTTTLVVDLSAAGGGAAVAPTVRATTAAGSVTTVTTVAVAVPAGTLTGERMIAHIAIRGVATITPPSGWTLTTPVLINTGVTPSISAGLYERIATGSEPATYTWTLSAAVGVVGQMLTLTGADTTVGLVAATQINSGTDTSTEIPAVMVATAQSLALAFGIAHGNTSYTVSPSGMIEILDTKTVVTNNVTAGVFSRSVATVGTLAATVATTANAAYSLGYILVIAPISSTASTITVKHNQMRPNDVVYMEANGKVEFMQVISGPIGTAGNYAYTMTRNLDGTGSNAWSGGDAVFNTGTAGSGFIDLYSLHGVNGYIFDHIYNYDNGAAVTPFEGGIYSQNYAQSTNFPLFGDNASTTVNDAMYFGVTGGMWNNVYGNTVTPTANASYLPVWEYWNGSAWTGFTPTASGIWYGGVGWAYEWTIASLVGWTVKTINGQSAFWVRWRIGTWTSTGTPALQGQRRMQWRARVYGPTIAMNVRNSTVFNDWGVRTALGNLNGNYDYGNDLFGFATGKYDSTWLSADEVNGVRIMNGLATKARWYTNGNILIGEQATGQSNVLLSAGRVQLRNNTSDVITLSATAAADGTIATFEGAIGFGVTGGLWNGSSGTFGGPITGFKQYRSGTGKGLWETWSGGVKQVWIDDDMGMYAGGGAVKINSAGITAVSPSNAGSPNIQLGLVGVATSSIYAHDSLGRGKTLALYHYATNNVGNQPARIEMAASSGGSHSINGPSIIIDSLGVIELNPAGTPLGYAKGIYVASTETVSKLNPIRASEAVIGIQGADAGFWKWGNAFAALTAGLSNTVLNANAAGGEVYFNTGGVSRARVNGSGDVIANGAMYASNWFRSYGLTGWFAQDYTVGIKAWQTGWAWVNDGGFASQNLRTNALIAEGNVSIGIGGTLSATNRLVARGATNDSTQTAILAQSLAAGNLMYARNDGQVWANQAWTIGSDRRLKDDIRYLDKDDALRVLALQPTSHVYRNTGQRRYGFIAQDVLEAEPTMVDEGEDGFLSLAETGIIALLVAHNQNLEQRLRVIEKRISP